jgi:hypothetical protein
MWISNKTGIVFEAVKERGKVMDVTAIVLHKGALAHYNVHKDGGQVYEAHLLRYKGARENEPPQDIAFQRAGRHCTGSTDEQDLMDDIMYAVQAKEQYGGSTFSNFNPQGPMSQ